MRTAALARKLAGAGLAAALCCPTAAGSAAADAAIDVPRPDEVFTDYTLGTFRDGRIATPQQIWDGLFATDEFHDEPVLRGDEPPGTLLRAEPFDVLFAGFTPGNLAAWKTMYVTENLDGTADIGTGVVLVPRDGRDNADRPVVAYQEANDSVGPNCHPSSQWSGGMPLEPSSWSALGPLAQMWSSGAATVIADVGNDADPGPRGIFAGRYAGMALLNGVRAAYAIDDLDLNPDNPVGIFGIAGGGVGGGFAAEYQPHYAPEINLQATVLEALVPDQSRFIDFASDQLGSGFALATILGLEAQYPQMRIDEKLTPAGRAVADVFRSNCQGAYFGTPFLPLEALFTSGLAPADIPEFQEVFADNNLGYAAPTSKVLISNCREDNSFIIAVPASDAPALADRYRALGTDVTFHPLDCGTDVMLTQPYRWVTELYGMHTVDWLMSELTGD